MRIAVAGCAGRMGQMLVREVLNTEGCLLTGGSERADSPFIGKDIGTLIGHDPLAITVSGDTRSVIANADAFIDFTTPAATLQHAALCAELGCAHIIGTTGLSADQEAQIRIAAERTVIVLSPNMSVGVNALMALVERTAALLDDSYDIEIVEMHHRHKVDAPSGTALGLGQAAARGRGVDLDAVAEKVRDGKPGPRKAGNIGFATLRGGDVVGDHTVIFAADGERIELTHKASSRSLFARGAVRAARWTDGKKAGLYSMRDVLGL